jgi:hypothetical protein
LGEKASTVIDPGTILVVDESLYEYNGDCPVKRYIPRKPHPNGLLVYGLSGYFHIEGSELPYCLDFEPYLLDNQVGAQGAMMNLLTRLKARKPNFVPHLVVDSAFGSLEKLREINALGAHATMSMPSNTLGNVWELLDFNCGIDEGRMAHIPAENIVISSFKVLTESRDTHVIKTISSGCSFDDEDELEGEEVVRRILSRREVRGSFQYQTEFVNGKREWLTAGHFIDDNGTVNFAWLDFVNDDDLTRAFGLYTHANLKVGAILLFVFGPFSSPIL